MNAETSTTTDIAHQLLITDAFPHEVTQLELLETHISWVILTGPFAYKIKKPIQFDFVDYSTLEKRKQFCQREVELNRRFAPELYLGVVAISQSNGTMTVGTDVIADDAAPESPVMESPVMESPVMESPVMESPVMESPVMESPVMEYAVKMQQFPQANILAAKVFESPSQDDDRQQEFALVEQLAQDIAGFHAAADQAKPDGAFAHPETILADAIDNFTMLESAISSGKRVDDLMKLKDWTYDQFAKLEPIFQARLCDGRVRLCHGDMHLKNIVELDGRWLPFDGIEFNEEFQWIDVLNEIAFPVMDFVARGRSELGWRLLNHYLEATGDYDGLPVLRFYLVYRALVRAKVTWLNPHNKTAEVRKKYSVDPAVIDPLAGPWDKYLSVAAELAFGIQPTLSITHGFSGSGKSTVALAAIDTDGGVRIRADAERTRLASDNPAEPKYSSSMDDCVYQRLSALSRTALESGLPVIADATFLKRVRRIEFERLAAELNVPYAILDCDAPMDELRRRIATRNPSDPSEATVTVLEKQLQSHDPLTEKERQIAQVPHPASI